MNSWTCLFPRAIINRGIVGGLNSMTCEYESRDLEDVRRLVKGVHDNDILAKLNRLTHGTARLVLYVLIRARRGVVELHPAGGCQVLPQFCQVFRSTPEGEARCRACRSLVAVGACAQGPSEFVCHGGISVFAAPALRAGGTTSDRVVVASCAVARRSHARGWRSVASHVHGLGLDVQRLKGAYYTLPAITEPHVSVVTGIVDLAASILGEFEERLPGERTPRNGLSDRAPARGDEAAMLSETLVQAADPSFRSAGKSTGSLLVDLVIATVKRNPSLPHNVASIAHAARITPNHLSALFHRLTGKTFREFLTRERIVCACDLLRDPRLSVAEVARRSGFEDPAYFSRRFRLVTGHTPTEWRNGSSHSAVLPVR